MDAGGGTWLLGSCWLVVPAMTAVYTAIPESLMVTEGFEAIPWPITVLRVLDATLVNPSSL